MFTTLEICAGAGGMALGLELAGFGHRALVEIDADACATLSANRPSWNVVHADAKQFDPTDHRGADLLAGGVPCPPFSIAGLRKGGDDERDLFPTLLTWVSLLRPKAVLVENVPGLAEKAFTDYLRDVVRRLRLMGYDVHHTVLKAFEHGVAQLRPRFVLVAIRRPWSFHFRWPYKSPYPYTVGDVCLAEMGSRGWEGTEYWHYLASARGAYAPTIVAGSRIHGGPDMGPSRTRERWRNLGFSSKSVADAPPEPGQEQPPRITMNMLAAVQGFPPEWTFIGNKTSRWKQIGNAFPAAVSCAVGKRIAAALVAPKFRAAAEHDVLIGREVLAA